MGIIIAIDGPAGSGKSTIAKRLAEKLNIKYLDTGAMFRAVAYKFIKNEINISNEDEVINCLKNTELNFVENCIYLDGNNVENDIRTVEVTKYVTPVSQNSIVRDWLLVFERNFALNESVVMDGRDIGTVVFPNADVKIYLTASLDVRAKRRFMQFSDSVTRPSIEEIAKDLERRDFADKNRTIAPLKIAEDAHVIDSSDLDINEVIVEITNLVKQI